MSRILYCLLFCLTLSAATEHNIVYREAGRYGGWPANHHIWSWGNEVVVGFESGHYKFSDKTHSIDYTKPAEHLLARSLDGGLTWVTEKPEGLKPPPGTQQAGVITEAGKPIEKLKTAMNFQSPDFAFTARMASIHTGPSRFYFSYDRGKSWQGPYQMPDFGTKGIAARTDYLIDGVNTMTIFLTAAKSNSKEGRVLAARTIDGGKNWRMLGYVTPEPEGDDYAIMPSSVRLSATSILTLVRYRNWIDSYRSDDNGVTWRKVNRVVEGIGGNPPMLVKLRDGRLVVTYGFRKPPYGIRARVSDDGGEHWGEEIILRSDAGNWDVGYTRTVQRPDGRMLTVYYYNDAPDKERFIGSTIWDVPTSAFGSKPFLQSEIIFPMEHWHNHSSSIVELPNGDLMATWFHGSGERTADDVVIMGARKPRSTGVWTKPFLLADLPGFPDTNPVLYVDKRQRLWLFWPTILAHQWESALMNYKLSSDYMQADGAPIWNKTGNVLVAPVNMAKRVEELIGKDAANPKVKRLIDLAKNEQFSRLGWFTRTHPVELPNGRMLLPLYSDGYSMSLMGISDDGGDTWTASEPIVGYGNIQPAVVRKANGDLMAFMRDNGPAPKRVHSSVSKDQGLTWSRTEDIAMPNPGSSVEVIQTRSGHWLMICNDLENGRHSLVVSMSDDEGKTWKWQRHLEKDTLGPAAGRYHYPSAIEAADGTIHVTYSIFTNDPGAGEERKSIKHARFNLGWVQDNASSAVK